MAQRRRRHAGLRRRAVSLSLLLFALTWVAVFGQMAIGHDPVLGSRSKTASSAAKSGGSSKSTSNSVSSTDASSQPAATPTYYMDPTTGQIYSVPSGSSSSAQTSPQPSSAPPPVVTSSS